MTQVEMEKLMELADLMKQVPEVSPVVTDVGIYRVGVRDCEYIIFKSQEFLTSLCTYQRWKNRIGTGEIDDDYILECKEKSEIALQDLKDFIQRRAKEGWQ